MTATKIQSQQQINIQAAGDYYRECNRKIDHLIEQILMADAWDNVDKFRELNQKLEVAVADARLALADWDTAIAATSTEERHTYKVELASNESELDSSGNEVPVDYKTVDVIVFGATAISTVLQASGHLDGYGIVSHWLVDVCDCF